MMPSNLDIQRIVQEVMRRLDDTETTNRTTVASSCLVWPHKVVSAQALEHRLDGVRELVVATAAIITPAANDELRCRGVTVVRADQHSSLPFVPVAIEGKERRNDVSDAVRIKTDEEWRSFVHDAVSRRQAPLAITPQPHRVACIANRNELVRAIAITDLRHLEDVVIQTQANVLCVATDVIATKSLPMVRGRWQRLAANQAEESRCDKGDIR
jgi:hypothetical protein